jgi:hypothetical protein
MLGGEAGALSKEQIYLEMGNRVYFKIIDQFI